MLVEPPSTPVAVKTWGTSQADGAKVSAPLTVAVPGSSLAAATVTVSSGRLCSTALYRALPPAFIVREVGSMVTPRPRSVTSTVASGAPVTPG